MSNTSSNTFLQSQNNNQNQNNSEPYTVYTELFAQQPIPKLNDNNSNQLSEILNYLRKLDQNLTALHSKTDRITTEMISIRNEVSSIRKKLHGDVACIEYIVPQQPFTTMEQYTEFENSLENEEFFKQFIKELTAVGEKSYEKFIRVVWKKIFCDKLAEQFSWRGTLNKKCIRGSRLTLAIRSSFKNKFALEDGDFDKISQRFFQYAHDRLSKSDKYQDKKLKLNPST